MSSILQFFQNRGSDIIRFVSGLSASERFSILLGIFFVGLFVRGVKIFFRLINPKPPAQLAKYTSMSQEEAKEYAQTVVDSLIDEGVLEVRDASDADVSCEILLNGKPLSKQKEG